LVTRTNGLAGGSLRYQRQPKAVGGPMFNARLKKEGVFPQKRKRNYRSFSEPKKP